MGQIPFLRILVPTIGGFLFCKHISPSLDLFPVGVLGLAIILLSFFIPKHKIYNYCWLFGFGLMLFLFSSATHYYQFRAEQVACDFPQEKTSYIGNVIDLPQQKPRSIACEMELTYPVVKKVMLYLEPDVRSQHLTPGDELVFSTNIQPFKNIGNPGEFDYKGFMHNKGFSGSGYANVSSWVKTGRCNKSIKSKALRVRAAILEFYKSFELDSDAYSFLSAITLGYKADLSEDIKNAFRASGTSHILAVSGLHVGIIYLIIIFMFSFLGRHRKAVIIKYLLVLLLLWCYVFITGMPVSVVRAAIMLSLVTIGKIIKRDGLTYNTLAVSAFIVLLINPFYLFDVGFQLSFVAVLSILFFQPKLSKLYVPKNKVLDYIWSLFTVSLAAQLGVFPLILHYFGTFSTYFFITNLLVLPFIGIIIYSAVILSILSLLSIFNIEFIYIIYNVVAAFTQVLIKSVLQIVYFIESLPYSVLDGFHISYFQVFLIFAIIISITLFILHKYAGQLITFLATVALLLLSHSFSYLKQPDNHFFVYNSYSLPDMGYMIEGEKVALSFDSNQVVAHPSSTIILLTENSLQSKKSNQTIPVDYLIVASDNSFSISELMSFFQPKEVIIDASINRYTAAKMKNECEDLGIAFYDISNSGAFLVNF